MFGLRPATWVFLIWVALFPVLWLVLMVNAEGYEGEPLRYYDYAFAAMVGTAIWLGGIVITFLVWELDHWLVERRRRRGR